LAARAKRDYLGSANSRHGTTYSASSHFENNEAGGACKKVLAEMRKV
jgi:hypothetical protein